MHEKLIRGLKKNGLVRVEAPLVGHPLCAAVLVLLCEEGDDFEPEDERAIPAEWEYLKATLAR